MKQQLEIITLWYNSLSLRDKNMLFGIAGLLLVTLFYLAIWEPIHQGLEQQQQKYKSQQDI